MAREETPPKQKFTKEEVADMREEHNQLKEGLEREFRSKLAVLLTGAFTLVAALSWNDLLKMVVFTYLPQNGGILPQLVTTLLFTTIAVIAIVLVSRLKPPEQKNI